MGTKKIETWSFYRDKTYLTLNYNKKNYIFLGKKSLFIYFFQIFFFLSLTRFLKSSLPNSFSFFFL